jgi:GxxExxY protein
MKFEKLTEKIIGCAYQVYNEMGFGYLESVYEKCLLIEFKNNDILAESQVPIEVKYDGESVGNFSESKVEIKRKVREL